MSSFTDHARYANSPWSLPFSNWLDSLKRTALAGADTDTSMRCAGVAFFGFLSLFPAIASGVLIYGLLGDRTTLQSAFELASDIMPASVASLLFGQLETLLNRPAGDLGIGLIITLAIALWSGSRGVNALVYALSKSHFEEDERPFILSAALSLGLTIGAFAGMSVALFALAIIPAAVNLFPLSEVTESVVLVLRWPVLACLIFVATCLLYRVAPDRADPKWRWIVPGALVSTLFWLAASILFSLYVENFGSYDATFGSLAAAVVLMLWLYYSTMIFVLGSRLNAELELQTKIDTTSGLNKPIGERNAYPADNIRVPSENAHK